MIIAFIITINTHTINILIDFHTETLIICTFITSQPTTSLGQPAMYPMPCNDLKDETMRINRLAYAISAVLTAQASLASAEQNAQPTQQVHALGKIQIEATRSANITLDDSSKAISLVTEDDINSRPGAMGVQQLMEDVPGVSFARSGGLGGQMVIRGFNSNSQRSIMAIDGDRYRGRSTLQYNMIDPNAIERIEVIRGPASSIYGGDAMSGVVNIVTRRSHVDPNQDFGLNFKIRSVDYNSVNNLFATRGEIIGGGDGFDVLIGGHFRKGDDYQTPIGKAENSAFDAKGLDWRIGYSPTSESRWEFAGRIQEANTGRAGGLGAAPGLPYIKMNEEPIRENYFKLGYEGTNFGAMADALSASLYMRTLDTTILQENKTNPAVTVKPELRVDGPTIYGGKLIADKQLGAHFLTYGMDAEHQTFDGRMRQIDRVNPNTGALIAHVPWHKMDRSSEQLNLGLFINDEWQATNKLTLSGSVRVDYIETKIGKTPVTQGPGAETPAQQAEFASALNRTETPITGGIGMIYAFTDQWSAIANLNQGFRAASGMDRSITSTAGSIITLPSPNLKPEKNITYEAGVRFRGQQISANLVGYRSDYTDLINLAVVSSTLRQRQNIGKATVEGIEFDAAWEFNRNWLAKTAITYTEGKDTTNNVPLESIQPLTTRLGLRYTANDQAWYSEAVYRGAQKRTKVNPTTERERAGYDVFDLYAGLDLGKTFGLKSWHVAVGVENLFDQTVRNPVAAEDISYSNRLIGNPLVEPGRAFVARIYSVY